jgi:enoyl-CoA hydratase
MEYKHIIYQSGKVAQVILNRPGKLNAQSYLMREEMDDAFDRAANDDRVGAIILTGAGQHFCAGHDIGTDEDIQYRMDHGHIHEDRYGDFMDMRAICLDNTLRWRNLPKPTIAMVRGYCIFAGCMFASAMDIIFAAENAQFLPGQVQYLHTPWDLGPRKAKEILFEHRFMTAREACRHGLVNRVYPQNRLEAETMAYAARVADNFLENPFWVRMLKHSINHMQDAMGFTNEMESGYNNYCLMLGLTNPDIPPPDQGGFARTHIAKKNFEASKPWIESED